jgi:hypothetical protein
MTDDGQAPRPAPLPPQPYGLCKGCRTLRHGRAVVEEVGASGGGLTIVVCLSCDTRPPKPSA